MFHFLSKKLKNPIPISLLRSFEYITQNQLTRGFKFITINPYTGSLRHVKHEGQLLLSQKV